MENFGIHNYSGELFINAEHSLTPNLPLVIDVETDEKDNFVGIGYTQDGKVVYYSTNLVDSSRKIANYLIEGGVGLIGHNLKFDAKLLVKWGIGVASEHIYGDTQLMSYCHNTTKETHALKELGKELGYEWPAYKELVGKGRAKVTLDKQPVELVANYCGMDVFVTFQLYQNLKRIMDLNASRSYSLIELPLMRILFEMELRGVLIDTNRLNQLDVEFSARLDNLKQGMFKLIGKEFNPNSNAQVGEILIGKGFQLPKTPKGQPKVDKFALEPYLDDAFVKALSEYNKIEKLWSTYTQGFLKLGSLPRIFTTYNQITFNQQKQTEVGISTGRLSSSKPNLQQIPTRTDEGEKLRELFIPSETGILIDADYSQIEPRLVAHYSKDPFLMNVYKNNLDIYEQLVEGTGRSRDDGKTFMLALLYGAQAKKLARNFKCCEEEAQDILNRINRKIPGVTAWINRVKHAARAKKGVYTLMKRWIPIPNINSDNRMERFHCERAAVNYTIQGSAAEVLKMAMIELRKKGFLPLLTVHDELLFEVPKVHDPEFRQDKNGDFIGRILPSYNIKMAMESVVKLDVPLVAEVGIGINWKTAKGD